MFLAYSYEISNLFYNRITVTKTYFKENSIICWANIRSFWKLIQKCSLIRCGCIEKEYWNKKCNILRNRHHVDHNHLSRRSFMPLHCNMKSGFLVLVLFDKITKEEKINKKSSQLYWFWFYLHKNFQRQNCLSIWCLPRNKQKKNDTHKNKKSLHDRNSKRNSNQQSHIRFFIFDLISMWSNCGTLKSF